MELLEFKSIDRNFRYDLDGGWWSRIYEYPLMLDLLTKYGANSESSIHNTCWGFEGCHVWFKDILDSTYPLNINSDLKASLLPNTTVYNILHGPKEEWIENFDFVLNVSTLEEIKGDHLIAFNNSFSMVKPGGYFICTFDIPGLQMPKFEDLFNTKFSWGENHITGENSDFPQSRYQGLSCGYMVVQK